MMTSYCPLTMEKSKVYGIIAAVIIVLIAITAAGEIFPEAMDAGDQWQDDTRCNAQAACIYNLTVSATEPCRDSDNQSILCTTFDSGDSIPLQDLVETGGVMWLAAIAAVLILLVAIALRKR